MRNWTRRELLKTGAAAAALPGVTLDLNGAAEQTATGSQDQAASKEARSSARERLLLDFDWRFHLGHANDPHKDFGFGANGEMFAKSGGFVEPGRANFDDSDWEAINLPHDWAISLPFQNDRVLTAHGSKPLGRTYPETSIGWYRKTFDAPGGVLRRYSLEFDGVFRDSIVVFNGHYLGRNLSGYAPFAYDVTDFMNYGAKNVLVLRVDATENEGWFYEGAGIYRHVWLVVTNPVHIPQWGTVVRAQVNPGSAAVSVTTEIDNRSDAAQSCVATSTIYDPAGRAVGSASSAPLAIPAWSRAEVEVSLNVARPQLWSVEDPHLYRAITRVTAGGAAADEYETPFGIRTLRFDAAQGFFLNGRRIEMKGTCNHQDHAGVGAALPDRLQYYRIERLKEMGSNAYRTSHNPPTPELLDACDRLGMLVMDETRMMSSNPEGLSQLERLIRRDRNHPSIVIWSLGNEEREQGSERGARIVSTMKRLAARLDPSRPVTVAMNGAWGRGVSSVVDVQGFNYAGGGDGSAPTLAAHIDSFHAKFPAQPTVGTETASVYSTRGIYVTDKEKGYVSAYDVNFPKYTTNAEGWWTVYDERPFVAGGFAWTGFDYRGEPSPYGWPCISSHYGVIDTCGFPKDSFFYYQAWWGAKPVLHLFPHWNWSGKEGEEIDVWVYSNLERVELLLNGKSVGAQHVHKNAHLAWKVKYAPGAIEARGFRGGRQVMTSRRETTGAPARLALHPDRTRIDANGEDLAVVALEVHDTAGRMVAIAQNEISFEVSGPGRLVGVGNGDPSCHESDRGPQRSAFNGLCMALVQGLKQPGTIEVRASSPGLESASAAIESAPAKSRPAAC
jgi:beta-galactosidase